MYDIRYLKQALWLVTEHHNCCYCFTSQISSVARSINPSIACYHLTVHGQTWQIKLYKSEKFLTFNLSKQVSPLSKHTLKYEPCLQNPFFFKAFLLGITYLYKSYTNARVIHIKSMRSRPWSKHTADYLYTYYFSFQNSWIP